MDDDERVWISFVRQRRNILLVATGLIFVKLAKIHFDSEIVVLGNHATIGNPRAIKCALWTLWGYWLYRYFVIFLDLADSGYKRKVNLYLSSLAKRLALNKIETETGSKVGNMQYLTTGDSPLSWVKKERFAWRATIESVIYDPDGEPIALPNEFHVEVRGAELRRLRIQAHIAIALKTRFLTEYWLPFLLGILAPVVWFIC